MQPRIGRIQHLDSFGDSNLTDFNNMPPENKIKSQKSQTAVWDFFIPQASPEKDMIIKALYPLSMGVLFMGCHKRL